MKRRGDDDSPGLQGGENYCVFYKQRINVVLSRVMKTNTELFNRVGNTGLVWCDSNYHKLQQGATIALS